MCHRRDTGVWQAGGAASRVRQAALRQAALRQAGLRETVASGPARPAM
jgi:hypothetical protein